MVILGIPSVLLSVDHWLDARHLFRIFGRFTLLSGGKTPVGWQRNRWPYLRCLFK